MGYWHKARKPNEATYAIDSAHAEAGDAMGSGQQNPALGGVSELLVWFKLRLRIALAERDRDPFLGLLHQR